MVKGLSNARADWGKGKGARHEQQGVAHSGGAAHEIICKRRRIDPGATMEG